MEGNHCEIPGELLKIAPGVTLKKNNNNHGVISKGTKGSFPDQISEDASWFSLGDISQVVRGVIVVAVETRSFPKRDN